MIDLDTIEPAAITRPEATPMLFVDCPLCDAPAPFDAALGALDCPVCAVILDVADDEPAMELPAAA